MHKIAKSYTVLNNLCKNVPHIWKFSSGWLQRVRGWWQKLGFYVKWYPFCYLGNFKPKDNFERYWEWLFFFEGPHIECMFSQNLKMTNTRTIYVHPFMLNILLCELLNSYRKTQLRTSFLFQCWKLKLKSPAITKWLCEDLYHLLTLH